jgi:D-beta-D-heptose 7-phosphate kinase/D-beta-D-heptose 1-phosphate adenosyltransferase
MNRSRLSQLLARFKQQRLLVLGDLMLDQFIWGKVSRISPEAPVPVVEFERETLVPGGAGNVARNVCSLGGTATILGLVGADENGQRLIESLTATGVDTRHVVRDSSRQTTVKTRIVAHQQQVVRLDRETSRDFSGAPLLSVIDHLREALPQVDAVLVGDYSKGFITQALVDECGKLARQHKKILAFDPKPRRRLHLRGLTLLTPNRAEAFALAQEEDPGRKDSVLSDAALLAVGDKLMRSISPQLLLVTLGDQGMCLFRRGKKPFHIPTVAQEVFDVSGAAFTLALAAGATPVEAALISNHAAGVVVGKVGTATVTPEELVRSFRAVLA